MSEAEKEAKDFARWLILQTRDVDGTFGPCRLYNYNVVSIDECYDEYLRLKKTIEVLKHN